MADQFLLPLTPTGSGGAADCGGVGRALQAWGTDVLPRMDHELRTPLTTMAGWCDVLLTGELGPLSPEQRAAVERIARAGTAVTRAISVVEGDVGETLVGEVAATCHHCDSRTWPMPVIPPRPALG